MPFLPQVFFVTCRTDLHQLACMEMTDELKKMITAGADVNALDNMKLTPLIWAARAGRLESA